MSTIQIQTGSIELDSSSPSATSDGDTSTFTEVTFSIPFPTGSTVIVVPMVQTFRGSDTPGLRLADVTTTGFKIRINELVVSKGGKEALSDGIHLRETIGWVAFSV